MYRAARCPAVASDQGGPNTRKRVKEAAEHPRAVILVLRGHSTSVIRVRTHTWPSLIEFVMKPCELGK